MTDAFAAEVLICGAGAAGLTLAIDLARRGVSFRLIEKMDEAFRGSRGKGIQPRTLEVFEDLGLIDGILAQGGLYPPQRGYRADGSFTDTALMTPTEPTPSEPYCTTWLIPQFATEAVMRERLDIFGHAVEFGCELVGLEQDGEGVTARLRHGTEEETIRVRYLVGADGGRSFVRRALGVDFPGKTLGVRAIVADVRLSGLSRDVWHRFNEGSMAQQIAFCPLPHTDLYQIQGPIPADGEIDMSAQGLSALVRARTGRADIIVEHVSWASAFAMNARLADHYRQRHVFLVGDAAHTHPPTGGQGLNTSVQDAYNLGWKLAAACHGASDALLETYEAERRPIAAEMLGLATSLLDAARHGDMRRGREVHQLDLGYLDSPLALETPERTRSPFAGDRAPDAPLRTTDGQSVRLFDLLKGPHWTLLVFGTMPKTSAPRQNLRVYRVDAEGDLVDDAGHLNAAYACAPGDQILIRPDGYIGAMVSAGEAAALDAYFQKVGLGAASA